VDGERGQAKEREPCSGGHPSILPQFGTRQYNGKAVARGWESKSIESQQQDAEERSAVRPAVSAEESKRQALKDSLLLSRTRVLRDLESARHPRHEQILRGALAHLDAQLAALDG